MAAQKQFSFQIDAPLESEHGIRNLDIAMLAVLERLDYLVELLEDIRNK